MMLMMVMNAETRERVGKTFFETLESSQSRFVDGRRRRFGGCGADTRQRGRRNNTTSCPYALNIALEQLTNRFLLNSYPLQLIKRKIKEIKNNNFEPLKRDESKIVKKFNLCLDFTSERCYSIGLSL